MKSQKENFAGESIIKDILLKGADAITEGERDILRARKSYLTEDQIKTFLDEESIKATVRTEEVEESEDEVEETEEVDLEAMNVPQLKKFAKEQEIDLGEAKTKVDIIAILEEKLGE